MVDLSCKSEAESGAQSGLVNGAEFSCRVDLCSEGCHSEVVPCAQSGSCLALLCHGDHLQIRSNVNLFGELVVVGALGNTLRLDLGGGDPVFLVTGELGNVTGTCLLHISRRALVDGLDTKGKVARQALEVVDNVDTGKVGR